MSQNAQDGGMNNSVASNLKGLISSESTARKAHAETIKSLMTNQRLDREAQRHEMMESHASLAHRVGHLEQRVGSTTNAAPLTPPRTPILAARQPTSMANGSATSAQLLDLDHRLSTRIERETTERKAETKDLFTVARKMEQHHFRGNAQTQDAGPAHVEGTDGSTGSWW